jgi:hypothetical protein
MKPLRVYFQELGIYGIAPEDVVTELGFDDAASFPKITFKQKSFLPDKAISRVDALLTSDSVKVATRQLAPQAAGPAIAAPTAKQSIAAPVAPVQQAVDDAYEDESTSVNVHQRPPTSKPVVAPVKASDELAAKLDSLFDEL